MPTAAERQALLFLAAVAVVGAGARYAGTRQLAADLRAGESVPGPASDSAALTAQLVAIDSAQAARRARAPASGARRPRTRSAGVGDRPDARSRARASRDPGEEPTLSRGRHPDVPAPIDVNTATAEELERLPRVGPALARRIVAWRELHGPFPSVEALRHVRGIGVTTAARLAPLVTFSSGYRPFHGESRQSRRDAVPPTS